MAARTLNARQRLFVRELVWSDPPVSQAEAARRAGFKDKESAHAGYQLLRRPHVRAEYERQLAEREELVKLRALATAERQHALSMSKPTDILDADGKLQPFEQWPETAKVAVAAIEVEDLYEGGGEEREHISVLRKIKFHDPTPAARLFLQWAGKLKDKVEHDVAPGGTVQISINGIVKES